MTWIGRPADSVVRALLDDGPRVVTVHGLGGSGASALLARELAGRAVLRIDLGATDPRRALRRLRAPALVWLDQVHEREAPTARRLVQRAPALRFVVAAHAPLGLPDERAVFLPLLGPQETRCLLEAELGIHAVRVAPDALAALASRVGGWPIAVRPIARAVRVFGIEAVLSPGPHPSAFGLEADVRCESVLDDAWRALSASARATLGALSFAHAPIDAGVVLAALGQTARDVAPAVAALVQRGLALSEDGRLRVPAPVGVFARARLSPAARRRARATVVTLILDEGERARAEHRRDPVGAGAVLERLRGDLLAIACDPDPRLTVRAALILEPLLIGRLERSEVLALFERARIAASELSPSLRADVALALARTLIGRGEHESAEQVLDTTPELDSTPRAAAYRGIYLAHIAAWRGELDLATARLDGVDVTAANEVEEDALLQRIFVTFRRGDLDETDRLVRACAALADARGSARLASVTRRFAAEVLLLRGSPDVAAQLLERSRDELVQYGDHVGALFFGSRLVEALRAAGDHARAELEAEASRSLAARTGEATMELTVLGALDGERASWARVADLSWRLQIPMLREQAERWLARRAASDPRTLLRLDAETRSATLAERTLSLARRPTLWRALGALVDAHARGVAVSGEALFAVAWPGERAVPSSQRKRVQTCIWTLRKLLFGDALETRAEGYALAPHVRVV